MGCADDSDGSRGEADVEPRPKREPTAPIAEKPTRPALCARDRDDAVRDVFCAEEPPEIRSLHDLQVALDLLPEAPPAAQGNLYDTSTVATLLGHSTALSGHKVSSINPRLILFGEGRFLAYQRGVQKVEVIASARNVGSRLNFYLFEYEQECNRSERGCGPGDLYTPEVERGWLSVRIRDDEDLANTPSDCRQCHQRALEQPRLLMRELNNPWTHFLQPMPSNDTSLGPGVQGHDLLADYVRARGDERYGGFSIDQLLPIAPFLLESVVGIEQPVLFDAPGIETERWPWDPERGYSEQPRPSPTWESAYAAFKEGEQLALPYVEPRVTDPDKQAELSRAYTRYRAGELDASELPDLGDIFPDDAEIRARIGLQTEPDASAVDALIQACGSCHNDVLDQSLSRARFNIDLSRLDREGIERAIERLERAPGDPGAMPPPEARQLDPEARERLLEYLRDAPTATRLEPRLARAAEMGMAGGRNRRSFERR